MSFKRTSIAAALAALALGFAGPVFADKDSDKKKAEKEWKDAEKRQKKDGQAPGQGGAQRGGEMENPLLKILKLMNEVEDRLFDSDTGDFTQEEQRKIVEAMKFEGKTSEALDDLIKQVEQQQQQQQQQGQADKNEKKKQQKKKQQKNETEKERQEREKREKQQKEEEEKRKANEKQQKNPKQQAKDNERQKRKDQSLPPDNVGDLNQPNDASGRWGVLPSKLYQDAANSANQPAPGRWSELIKRYRARLADVD
jgi:hypothetical protein